MKKNGWIWYLASFIGIVLLLTALGVTAQFHQRALREIRIPQANLMMFLSLLLEGGIGVLLGFGRLADLLPFYVHGDG